MDSRIKIQSNPILYFEIYERNSLDLPLISHSIVLGSKKRNCGLHERISRKGNMVKLLKF